METAKFVSEAHDASYCLCCGIARESDPEIAMAFVDGGHKIASHAYK